MDENKDFVIPQDENENIPVPEAVEETPAAAEEVPAAVKAEEAAPEEAPEEAVPAEEIPVEEVHAEEVSTEEIPFEEVSAEEIPADAVTPEETAAEEIPAAEEIAEAQPEQPTTYRGVGTGRRESPFADSPYVIQHQTEETVHPRCETGEQPAPRKPKSKKRGWGKRILAMVAVLALVIGSCAFTAHTVNQRWEAQMNATAASFETQLNDLRRQVENMDFGFSGVSTIPAGSGLTAAQVYAKNARSVVLIKATVVTDLYGQTATGYSTGSGFILSENGYVVTNFHVVEGASTVDVVLVDGTTYRAGLVGYDSTNDLAVLKVEATGLSAVTLGSSNALVVGDQVVAIGNPLGELTATLTVGYVSAKERTINTDGTVINMIQTDAAINSGNSGGPLFNMRGEVVGITTAKYSGASSSGATIEGIGFAIPMDDVLDELEDLLRYGYIKSAYLGVLVQNMDASVAGIYGLPVGAYVVGVEEGYCAQKAGIREKDIITAVNDTTITTITDLTRALRGYEPGDKVTVTVYRAGQILELPVKLDERPAAAG